jgi:hypothetical protein
MRLQRQYRADFRTEQTCAVSSRAVCHSALPVVSDSGYKHLALDMKKRAGYLFK